MNHGFYKALATLALVATASTGCGEASGPDASTSAFAIVARTVVIDTIGKSVSVALSINGDVFESRSVRHLEWISVDPTIAEVDEEGSITAINKGTTFVVASSSTGADSLRVTVFSRSIGFFPITGSTIPCEGGLSAQFECDGVDLLSFLPLPNLGALGAERLNDVWGWTDSLTGKEFVLVGRTDGLAFVDVSDPVNPAYLGELPRAGSRSSGWRDVKVYRNHAFVVADGAGSHGMQVFNLEELRSTTGAPTTFTATFNYDGIGSAHNIVINEASGFGYIVGSSSGGNVCGGGLHMVDLRTPASPTFAGCFADNQTGLQRTGYTHDAMCINYTGPDSDHSGREVCFGSNETALSIADVTDKTAPTLIANATYPNVAYTHQGWISEDQRYFFVNDELDERNGLASATRTLVWDIEDLDDPILAHEYLGPTRSIDHNLYIRGDNMYQSNYTAGFFIVDVRNATRPRQVGFFDTTPGGTNGMFGGTWSNYPFFDSGVIAVTSGNEGLFILKQN